MKQQLINEFPKKTGTQKVKIFNQRLNKMVFDLSVSLNPDLQRASEQSKVQAKSKEISANLTQYICENLDELLAVDKTDQDVTEDQLIDLIVDEIKGSGN